MMDFISWSYDPKIVAERTQSIRHIMQFILDGLSKAKSFGSSEVYSISLEFDAAIKGALFEKTVGRPVPFTKKMMKDAGDTVELIATSFEAQHDIFNRGGEVARFGAGSVTDKLMLRLCAFSHPNTTYSETSVALAYEVAYSNLARTHTRLTLLRTLVDLLNIRQELPVFEKIRNILYSTMIEQQRNLLLFGALGGEVLMKNAVRTIASQTVISEPGDMKFSVIQHLQLDGVIPGMYNSDEDRRLRQDIEDRFNGLMLK